MSGSRWPALLVAGWLLALVPGTALVVLLWAGDGGSLRASDLAVVRFTLVQAALSAVISVALAVPVARALFRRRFRGRALLIALLGAPFLLPTLVAVLAMLAVFGRSGWFNQLTGVLGLPSVSIYGLQGVVIAHVFLNLPLAVRMILQGWQDIPADRFRLAAGMGFDPVAVRLHLEYPMLRAVLPGAALAVFTVCLTSFAVALTLGGGPRATTLELAIYQAVRFDFDLPRAALLALVQLALAGAAVLLAARISAPAGFGAGLRDGGGTGFLAIAGWRRRADAVVIVMTATFLLVPLGAVALRGIPALADLPQPVWQAALRSVLVALSSGLLAVTGALVLALAVARGRRLEAVAMLPLAASSLVLGTGLFLALRTLVSPASVALPVTVAVNATLALPFAFRILLPPARNLHAEYARLAASLGLHGGPALRWLVLPRLRAPLGFAAGVASALAMGDLGVIVLFAGEQGATLPLMVQRLMGAYRMDQAMAAAVLLTALGFALFWLFDAWGRRHVAP